MNKELLTTAAEHVSAVVKTLDRLTVRGTENCGMVYGCADILSQVAQMILQAIEEDETEKAK